MRLTGLARRARELERARRRLLGSVHAVAALMQLGAPRLELPGNDRERVHLESEEEDREANYE